jgi:hypothetical protein
MKQKLQICFLLATCVLVFQSETFMPNVCVFNLKMTTPCMQIRHSSMLSVNLTCNYAVTTHSSGSEEAPSSCPGALTWYTQKFSSNTLMSM